MPDYRDTWFMSWLIYWPPNNSRNLHLMPDNRTSLIGFGDGLFVVAVLASALTIATALKPVFATETPSFVPAETPRHLFQITLHTPEELSQLLTRAERLARTTRPADRRTGIALILHGPEVEVFARRNYSRYRHIVDLAARLDAEGVIEVEMCQTEMRARGIGEQDVPAFVKFVPYGPEEEARLRQRGYIYF